MQEINRNPTWKAGDYMGKTYTDDMIVNAIMSSKTNIEAVKMPGINERYFYTRLREKPLQAKLEAARANLTQEVSGQLRQSLTAAVSVLTEIMQNDEASPQVRVNAANSVIQNYMRVSERDAILNRLEAIENEL